MDIKTANRLQQLRKMNGLSQDTLAEKLGISRQAISKWERAESSPDTDNLIALAELYGLTLDELLNSSEDKVILKVEETKKKKEKRPPILGKTGEALLKFPYPIIVVMIYLICGFAFSAWHPAWLIFLTIAVYYHFGSACMTKSKKSFLLALPVPEVIIILYLLAGFYLGAWGPATMMFLIIPVYYWAVAFFIKETKEPSKNEENESNQT